MLKEYLNLLARREGKVVLGKHLFNLWILTVVLTTTFLAIAFSNGSLYYLSEKMNDPFTNWVNISNEYGAGKFDELRENLGLPEVQERYLFGDVQADNNFAVNILNEERHSFYLQCRFFERLESSLIYAVLSPDNLVGNTNISPEEITNETFGYIVTEDVLTRLGYNTKDLPAFVDYLAISPHADTLGVKLYQDKYAAAPMPILAVVKRLPMNMDIIGSRYWFEQYCNDVSHPFDFNHPEYQERLIYFVKDGTEGFEEALEKATPDSLKHNISVLPIEYPEMKPSVKGTFYQIYVGENIPGTVMQEIADKIKSAYKPLQVYRVYRYMTSENHLYTHEYMSVNFNSLDSIRAFEAYVKDNFHIQIEMSQVNAKENFNAVSIMANILSWAMIVFSIVCIVLFIVNMLQSYFQKVKRNLGTFKAFGISSSELISVYVIILFGIVTISIVLALIIAWAIQLSLPLFDILKDGKYNYLMLWNTKTLVSAIIILCAALVTVQIVMGNMLHKTPGDLIYDRD